MKSIWQSRNFLSVFLISAGLGMSQQIYSLSVPLIVYYLTQSPILMGTIRGMEYIPNILLAILIGVIIDKTQPDKMFRFSIAGQFLALCALFICFTFMKHWQVLSCVLVFILMTCAITFNNLRTLIIKISIDKTLLTEANSVLQIVVQFIQVLGPVFSGLILLFTDPRYSLIISSIILAMTMVVSFNMKIAEREIIPQKNILHSIKDAWHFLYDGKVFFWLVCFAVFLNCSEAMTTIMYVVLAKTTLNLNNFKLGILFAAFGLGGVIGGFAMGQLNKIMNKLNIMKYSILASSLFYAAPYFFQNFSILLVVMLVEGLAASLIALVVWIYRQESTPQHLMGRVTGLTSTIFKIGLPVAAILSGIIAEKFGVKYVFLLGFFINIGVFTAYLFSPAEKAIRLSYTSGAPLYSPQ